MSDSQTKIIPAKRLEQLRRESRDAEAREIEVDVVFDDDAAETADAAPDPSLGATAAHPFDPLALDAAAAGATTTRRVWAVTEPSEDDLESVDHLAELEEDDAVTDDGWDDPVDSVPLQLTPSKAKASVGPLAAVAPSPSVMPRPALRSSPVPPPKKR